ncbi:protein FAM83D-B-like isoform X2 [Pristis pectinata]|uniref:protein FAM83D-B-like isoform X2 n=1 Tax=Pristis pectinata TaxID=685728 RepID=UPI00223C99C8|nr:protein FAM83D-B-like isoform X2 [Pristis pectinata]
MNDSQCLDDLPVVSRWTAAAKREVGVRDFYSESQRLALEELVAGGREAYLAFLHREKMPGFLSAAEIADILGSAVRPSESCNESLDQSFSGSQGQSTGTYFPDASDIEVPDLDLGWPVFPHNWYRGVTQVEVYFQPSYGELIYSCKEAIRNLIRKAEKVIALVMDSFTDIDILQDLHEACRRRRIPVYILLDQSGLPQFQQMCQDAGVWVEEERMRVRTLKGCTYYTRTGAKVIGRVHEKFMLIDCEKVATGSYSFTWTDGKLNRSNLTVLSGQLSEFYDEEFRILYAQSEPIPLKHTDYGNRAIYEEFTMKRLLSKDPTVANTLRQGIVECSPNKRKPAEKRPRPQSSVSSTDQCVCEASAPADNAPPINEEVKSVSTQTELEWLSETTVNGASTQTCILMKEMETQTSFFSKSSTAQTSAGTGIIQRAQIIASVPETSTEVTKGESTDLGNLPPASTAESTNSSSTSSGTTVSESQPCSKAVRYPRVDLRCADSSLKNYFQKLTKERQLHYSVIRSKLNNMVAILSRNQHLSVIHSRGPGQYNVRDKRELMSRSRVFGFRDAPMLASLALRN